MCLEIEIILSSWGSRVVRRAKVFSKLWRWEHSASSDFLHLFASFCPAKSQRGNGQNCCLRGTREFLPGHFSSNVFTTEFRPRAKARGVETCGKTASRCDVTSSICHFLRLVRWTWVTIVNAPVTRGGARAVMAGAFDESKHVQPPVAAPLIFGWI